MQNGTEIYQYDVGWSSEQCRGVVVVLLTQVHLGTAINIINITNTAITDDAIACNRAIIPGTLYHGKNALFTAAGVQFVTKYDGRCSCSCNCLLLSLCGYL